MLTPCTRWWPSGEAAATEGGIVVTVKRDNCPAERERGVEQTRKGSRLRVVKESLGKAIAKMTWSQKGFHSSLP